MGENNTERRKKEKKMKKKEKGLSSITLSVQRRRLLLLLALTFSVVFPSFPLSNIDVTASLSSNHLLLRSKPKLIDVRTSIKVLSRHRQLAKFTILFAIAIAVSSMPEADL